MNVPMMAQHQQPIFIMVDLLIPIVAIIVPCTMAFGIVYIIYTTRHRERMNMIDKGMDPGVQERAPEVHKSLRNGLLWVGIGIGLMVGWLFKTYVMGPVDDDSSALPLLIGAAIFGGLSQVLYYVRIGRKQQG